MSTCPHCGLRIEAKRKTKAPTSPVETATMTDSQLYAHYKKTSHIEDVRFVLRVCSDFGTVDAAAKLLAQANEGLSKSDTLRQLHALQDTWRRQDLPPADEAAFWAQAATMPQWWKDGRPAHEVADDTEAA